METDSICLTRRSEFRGEFRKDFCIICQQKTEIHVTSTANGRSVIRWAASERQDIVNERLNNLGNNEEFVYHMNNACYKKYTLKSTVAKIASGNKRLDKTEDQDCNYEQKSTDLKMDQASTSRKKNVSAKNPDLTPCIICGNVKMDNVKQKHRISEVRKAEKFLKSAKFFKDRVFNKVGSLKNAQDVFAADIYCHKNCWRSYEKRYEREYNERISIKNGSSPSDINNVLNESVVTESNVTKSITVIIESLFARIKSGEAFTLSTVTSMVHTQFGPHLNVNNRLVKQVLIDYFGEDISFSYPRERNISTLFYYSKISASEIADTLRAQSKVRNFAKMFKEALKSVDFDLQDKLCDASDLRSAWEKIEIPNTLLPFFCELFDISKEDLNKKYETTFLDLEDDEEEKSSYKNRTKILRLKSLFQIMHFMIHDGRKKTPLHVMNGLSIHSSTKSKAVITCLNRTGLSISYDDVLRYRHNLALYTVKFSNYRAALPSHFDKAIFTTAAVDNFDHEEASLSGLNGTHDTVAVLFQDEGSSQNKKPTLAEADMTHRDRNFLNILECQVLKQFSKPSGPVTLPKEYSVDSNIASIKLENYLYPINITDLTWFLARMSNFGVSSQEDESQQVQQVPSWAAFNSIITTDNRPKQRVGFLPILPHPVTEYSTVYTSLCNFNAILEQLDQKFLPVACDEGVYRIARHILFLREQEFKGIVLVLGGFHMIKIVFTCIGKYLKGTGIENIFIETGLFGVCVTEQILNGTNYARSVKALFMLAESLTRLQLKVFFAEEDNLLKYEEQVQELQNLRETLSERNFDESKVVANAFKNLSKALLTDFKNFVIQRCEESELFKYWTNTLTLIGIVRNLIRADREGNWELHVETVKTLQPIFHVFDRSNYARWSSIYIEDMQLLENNAPEVYRQFLKGRFTVKTADSSFGSVSLDQKLEMTINKSQKSISGIIGSTKKKEFVAVWDLVYHEMLDIINLHRDITSLANDNSELKIHHEYSIRNTEQYEVAVQKLVKYFENHVNPFQPGVQPLRNIVTEQLVESKIADSLLSIFSTGCDAYEKFRAERFCTRSSPISSVIHRTNLPSFNTTDNKNLDKGKNVVAKSREISNLRRVIELAKERNYPLEQLFTYELTESNLLFDEDGFLKKETNKSSLLPHLEKDWKNGDVLEDSADKKCLIVDVMMCCRRLKWKGMHVFKNLAEQFCSYVNFSIQKLINVRRIDFVFDSYFEISPKSLERIRRSGREFITLHKIDDDIPLPFQEKKFWASSDNKVLLQQYLREYIIKHRIRFWPEIEVICSGTNSNLCTSTEVSRTKINLQSLQRPDIEEADVRIMIHVAHVTLNGFNTVCLYSSDTDVIVLALCHWNYFKSIGLQALWMKVGVGSTTRYLRIDSLAMHLTESVCLVLPAVHHLTGSDYTSKLGTKSSGLARNPEKFLQDFGRDPANVHECTKAAEEFLVQVVRKDSHCKTFDELRNWTYHHAKSVTVENLPPTSNSVNLHILRAFYICYEQYNCLRSSAMKLDPSSFGYKNDDSLLVPERIMSIFPPINELMPSCNCKSCGRKTCICQKAEISCCSFCFCHSRGNNCKNPHTSVSD